MQNMFLDSGGRLRSGWRVSIFLIVFIFTAAAAGPISSGLSSLLGISTESGRGTTLAIDALVSLIPVLLTGWLCLRYIESLPFRSLGASLTRGWFKNLCAGTAFGSATLVLAVILASAAGGERFEFNHYADAGSIVRGLLISLVIFAAAAAFEEALFRGYVLQTFSRSGLSWLAIVLTSLLFGMVHAGNPNASAISVTNTVVAGIWFSVAYLKTRDLWFVFGIHLMWNWMQGAVFGIEVSGLTGMAGETLLRELDSGPRWLTGTTYGLEGGIACTIAILASTLAIRLAPWPRPDGELLAMTSPLRSGDLDLERDIDRAGRVGEPADRDEVDAGLGK